MLAFSCSSINDLPPPQTDLIITNPSIYFIKPKSFKYKFLSQKESKLKRKGKLRYQQRIKIYNKQGFRVKTKIITHYTY